MNLRGRLGSRFRLLNEEALGQLSAIDVFNEMIGFLHSLLRPVGMDVFDTNFRWNWRTSVTASCLASYFMSLVYTVYVHWGNWISILETLSLTGIAIQGLTKMAQGLINLDFFHQKTQMLETLYAQNIKHKENNRTLVFCGLLNIYIFKIFFCTYAMAGMGYLTLPLFSYIRNNELMLMVNLEVPGFDPTTSLGFTVTSVYHAMIIALAIAGICAADLTIMVMVLNIIGIADVFKNTLKELDQLLEKSDRNDEEVHSKLIGICRMHMELIAYEVDLKSVYGFTIFVQIITSVSCLALAIFTYYITRNITSALFTIAAIFQLLEFCLLGTALTLKNGEIMLALYDTYWYSLHPEEQRTLGFVLLRSQHAVEMTVGGVALLNMGTFVEIMKNIYTYTAMLMQFVE